MAAISAVVALDDLSLWFRGAIGELYATVAAQECAVAGPPGARISTDFFAHERGELTIFLPCAPDLRAIGRVQPLVLPAVDLATTVHRGDLWKPVAGQKLETMAPM